MQNHKPEKDKLDALDTIMCEGELEVRHEGSRAANELHYTLRELKAFHNKIQRADVTTLSDHITHERIIILH